jgi:hypothetical protein
MHTYKLALTTMLLFGFTSLFARQYTLHGKIKGVEDGWAFVRHRQTGQTDSGKIVKGIFTISGAATAPEFCNFGFSANGVKDYYLGFFLERGVFSMTADKAALNDVSIIFGGSRVEKAFQQFQRAINYINRHYYPESVNLRLEVLSEHYAMKHPQSYISAFALDSYENDPLKLSKLYHRLSPKIQRSYYGRLIQDKMTNR